MSHETSEDSFRTFRGVRVAAADQLPGAQEVKGLGLGRGEVRRLGPGNVFGESSTHACSVALVVTRQCEFLCPRLLSGWLFKVVLQKSPGTKHFAENTADRMGLSLMRR